MQVREKNINIEFVLGLQQGFLKKAPTALKLKTKIPELLSNDQEGKISSFNNYACKLEHKMDNGKDSEYLFEIYIINFNALVSNKSLGKMLSPRQTGRFSNNASLRKGNGNALKK